MNKYLYCKVMTATPGCLYEKLDLSADETAHLKHLGIYCVPSDDGTQMVGIFQLRALFSR